MKNPTRSEHAGPALAFLLFLLVLFLALNSTARAQGAAFDLQSYINRAPPNALVIIGGGVDHAGLLFIDKPLTIVGRGEPRPLLRNVVIESRTGGKLTLANLRMGALGTGSTAPDEVRLFDVQIEASSSEVFIGGVDYLEATRLVMLAEPSGLVMVGPGAAVLLDSRVGALHAFRAFSTEPAQQYGPDGGTHLPGSLAIVGEPRIGSTFELAWSVPAAGVLFGHTSTRAPLELATGCWHLGGSRFVQRIVSASGSLQISVPNDIALLRFTPAFQIVGGGRFSRPATGLVTR